MVLLMTRIRRVLVLVSAIWLSSQLATLTCAPFAMLASGAEQEAPGCTCPRGAEATCPMHHPPLGGSKLCALRGAAHHTAILTSLFGLAGFMPTSLLTGDSISRQSRPAADHRSVTLRPVAPDPPPPRA
jgi:hypothetical protein